MSEYQITNSVPVVRAADPWWVPAGRAAVLGLLVGLLVSTGAGVLFVLASFSLLDVLAVPPLAGLLVGLAVTLGRAWVGFGEHGAAVPAPAPAAPARVVNPIIARLPGSRDDQADEGQARPLVVDGRAALYQFLRRAYLVGLARSAWVGSSAPAAVRVSRSQYDAFCVSLGRAGIAVDDGRGWRLTASIDDAMKACGLVSLWDADGRAGGLAGGPATSDETGPRLRLVGKGAR